MFVFTLTDDTVRTKLFSRSEIRLFIPLMLQMLLLLLMLELSVIVFIVGLRAGVDFVKVVRIRPRFESCCIIPSNLICGEAGAEAGAEAATWGFVEFAKTKTKSIQKEAPLDRNLYELDIDRSNRYSIFDLRSVYLFLLISYLSIHLYVIG